MKYMAIAVLLLISLFTSSIVFSQIDVLRAESVKSLRGLRELQLVVRANDIRQVIRSQDLFDYIIILLKQKAPILRVAEDSDAWLELSYITHERGGLLSVYLHRHAVVTGLKESSFVTVWKNSKIHFGSGSIDDHKHALKGALDEILTGFVADYYRANP
jgi:hypothetical protein